MENKPKSSLKINFHWLIYKSRFLFTNHWFSAWQLHFSSISLQRSITVSEDVIRHSLCVVLKVGLIFLKTLCHFLSAVLSSELQAVFAQHLFIWRCKVISLVLQRVEWMLLSLMLQLPEASLRAQEPGGACSGCLVYVCEWREEWKWRKPCCLLSLLEYRPAVTQLPASHRHSSYHIFYSIRIMLPRTFMVNCNGLVPLFHWQWHRQDYFS